ncbi:non-ribosomal peptide synthetase, partial [Photorhabdus khanii]
GVGLDTWLRARHSRQAAYTEYGYLGLSEIRRLSEVSGEQGLFESLLVYENYPVAPRESGALQIVEMTGYEQTNYPLTVVVASDEQLHLRVEYSVSRFAGSTVRRLLSHLVTVLKGMSALGGEATWQNLRLLSQAEEAQLLGWSGEGGRYAGEASLPARFEAQVSRTPEQVALIYRETALSYRALNARSNRLAHALRCRYAKETGGALVADTLIGLYVERGLEMVTGMLAILKAGGAYVPLSPEYPAERVAWMLADTGARLVLTQGACRSQLEGVIAGMAQPPGLLVVDDEEAVSGYAEENPVRRSGGEDLAYVIYTSGTTGRPKGVMQNQRNVINIFIATEGEFKFDEKDIWVLYHSYSFDFSVWEIWGALLYGGCLIIPEKEVILDVYKFAELCRDKQVTILNQTPRAFYNFVDVVVSNGIRFPNLRKIIFGGDKLSLDRINPWWSIAQNNTVELVNMYGITEITIHATYKKLSPDENPFIANIGRPLRSAKAYVLDFNNPGKQVPVGIPGELYIGGLGLARGYLNQPVLTAERFLENSFATEQERACGLTRLYRTGDRVRWLPGGELEYLGRTDSQIKLRGFRVEPGEIESAIGSFEGVAQSVVILRDTGEACYLVAYVVPINKKGIVDISVLKTWLSHQLPEYMVPSVIIIIDEIPLTVNGKLDQKKLPEPMVNIDKRKEQIFDTLVEKEIRLIIEDITKLNDFDDDLDFFQLGIDSLNVVKMKTKIFYKFGLDISLKLIYENFTLSSLAMCVSSLMEKENTKVSGLVKKIRL